MSITYDGVTKSSGSGSCEGYDIYFRDVPAERTLVAQKIGGQGHQPFDVTVSGPDSFPQLYITQLENVDGKWDSGTTWTSNDENSSYTVWAPNDYTIPFEAKCDDQFAEKTVYFRWQDADDGTGDNQNKNASIEVIYYDNDHNFIRRDNKGNVGGQGVTGRIPIKLDKDVTSYEVVWHGLAGGNAIKMAAPYERRPGKPCEKPTGNLSLTCSSYEVSNLKDPDHPGSQVTFRILHNGSIIVPERKTDAGNPTYATGSAVFINGQTYQLQAKDIDYNTYSTVNDASPSCGIPPGTASCKTFGPTTAVLGSSPQIQVEFHNDANATDWHVGQLNNPPQPSDQHSGVQTSPAVAGAWKTLNEIYGTSNLGMLRHGHFAAPISNYAYVQNSPSDPGLVTYTFSIYNNSYSGDAGWFNGNKAMCSHTINWVGSWSLVGASGAPNLVEPGQTITYDHYVSNLGPNTADFTAWLHYNYDPADTDSGQGGWRDSPPFGVQISAGGSYENHPSQFFGNNTPLGQDFCQTFKAQPTSMNGGNPGYGPLEAGGWSDGGSGETVPACAKSVGGKTSIGATSPTAAEPGETITFAGTLSTPGFNNGGDGGYHYTVNCAYTLRYQRGAYGGGTSTVGNGPCTQVIDSNTAKPAVQLTFTVPANMSFVGNQLCIDINISPGGSTINGPNWNLIGTSTARACVEIVAKPYIKVAGGDVSAGSNFTGSGPCRNASASVMGWNKNNDPNYYGAGAQLAVFAQNEIRGFASGQGVPDTTNPAYGFVAPEQLAFANTGIDSGEIGGLHYGGDFQGATCIPDYYSGMPDNADTWVSLSDSNDKSAGKPEAVFSRTGNLTLEGVKDNSAYKLALGNNTRLYVNGDVYIKSDIVADVGATEVSQVPNFTLIVKGNIYIDPTVENLYGTYIAQPNGGTGGNIYTCGYAYGPYSSSTNNFVDRAYYGTCGAHKLVVTGSFSADKVYFLRTGGTLNQDNGGTFTAGGYPGASETFIYNPLFWMRNANCGCTTNNDAFDSIASLPPVL
jgi:hypothetical protein